MAKKAQNAKQAARSKHNKTSSRARSQEKKRIEHGLARLLKTVENAHEAAVAPVVEMIPPPLDYSVASPEDEAKRNTALRALRDKGLVRGELPVTVDAEFVICNGEFDDLPEPLKTMSGVGLPSVLQRSTAVPVRADIDEDDAACERSLAVRLTGMPFALEDLNKFANEAAWWLFEKVKRSEGPYSMPISPTVATDWDSAEWLAFICIAMLWEVRSSNPDGLHADTRMPLVRQLYVQDHRQGYKLQSPSLSESTMRELVAYQREPERATGDWFVKYGMGPRSVPPERRWEVPPYTPGCRWLVVAKLPLDVFTWLKVLLSGETRNPDTPTDLINLKEAEGLIECNYRTLTKRIADGTLKSYGKPPKLSRSEVMEKRYEISHRKSVKMKVAIKRISEQLASKQKL